MLNWGSLSGAEAGTSPLSALGSHALSHVAASDLSNVGLTQICNYVGMQPNTGAGTALAAACTRLLASGSQAAGVTATCQRVQSLSTSGVSLSVDSVCGVVQTAVAQSQKPPAAAPTMASASPPSSFLHVALNILVSINRPHSPFKLLVELHRDFLTHHGSAVVA